MNTRKKNDPARTCIFRNSCDCTLYFTRLGCNYFPDLDVIKRERK